MYSLKLTVSNHSYIHCVYHTMLLHIYKKLRLPFFLYREQFQSSHHYSEGPGPDSGHGHYDRLQGRTPHLPIDQYSDSSYRSDRELPLENREYFSSEDLRGPDGLHGPPVAGRYGGGSGHKRPTIGQAYACQTSPTQVHPPEKKMFHKPSDQEYNQDQSVKQGLRSWRINSYLNTYEEAGEDGLAQPMGGDAFEESQPSEQPTAPEISVPRFGIKEPPNVAPKPRPDTLRPRFGKPNLLETSNKDSSLIATKDMHSSFSDFRSSILEKKEWATDKEKERESERGTAREVGDDAESKDTTDLFLSRHESVRSRINPLLQRSSRLRSSLIFASSKGEIHSGSLGLKPATEEDEQLDLGRTSSIVAQILEKRRSLSREPFEWRKRAEEKDSIKEKEEKGETEKEQEKTKTEVKTDVNVKVEPQTINIEEKITPAVERPNAKSALNVNDVATRLQYFKDLEAKRKASKMDTERSTKAPEPPEKKLDLSEKPPVNPVPTIKTPTPTVSPVDHEPMKPDIPTKLAEAPRRPSFSLKPSMLSPKPFVSPLKPSDTSQTRKEENEPEGQKKDVPKLLKPLSSPKFFKKDQLKIKGLNPRRISCGDEILSTDATDAEKSEIKKIRSHSSSTLLHEDTKERLQKVMGSNTSINTIGEGKGEGKTLEFLKKQTQRLKGLLGPKDKEKKASGEEKGMSTVIEVTDDTSKKYGSLAKDSGSTAAAQSSANHKTSMGTSVSSRHQNPGSSVLFSSNLRDDTKVILEQISANSQKNRQEREESGVNKDSAAAEKEQEAQNSVKKSRFLRTTGSNQEREGLLKRIESLRKEKKVYSRFEVVDVSSIDGKNI